MFRDRLASFFLSGAVAPWKFNSYLGLLMSGFDLSDLSGILAEATFRWFFTFMPPEFSFAMRSAASFASLLGTVPFSSTDLPFFTSTVTLALARLGSFWIADWMVLWTSPLAAAGAASLCGILFLSELCVSDFFW